MGEHILCTKVPRVLKTASLFLERLLIDPGQYYNSEARAVDSKYLTHLNIDVRCVECPKCGYCKNLEECIAKECNKFGRCRKCKEKHKHVECEYLRNKLFTIVISSFACIENAQYFDLAVKLA